MGRKPANFEAKSYMSSVSPTVSAPHAPEFISARPNRLKIALTDIFSLPSHYFFSAARTNFSG